VEVEAARPQQVAGGLGDLVALDVLLADVQQADRRALRTVEGAGQRTAHVGELQQVLGRAVDVGAEIKHHRAAALRRQVGRDGGALDTRQHLQDESRHGHQGAGVSGTHAAVRLTLLDQVDGEPHGGIALVAQCAGRRFVHVNDLGRMMKAQPIRRRATRG